jgi:hypothetical protein
MEKYFVLSHYSAKFFFFYFLLLIHPQQDRKPQYDENRYKQKYHHAKYFCLTPHEDIELVE